MKCKSKIVAVAMALLFTLAIITPVLAAPSRWAAGAVAEAIELGIVPQRMQSNFTQATNRAEFAALAVALYENQHGTITGRETFVDTDDVDVEKAAYIGIVSGIGNNRFNPAGTLTREQAAVLVARLIEAIGYPLTPSAPTFADSASLSSWARAGVGAVQATGIMGGTGNNMFSPMGSYTREQSIVTMMRVYEFINAGDEPVGPTPAPGASPTPAASPTPLPSPTPGATPTPLPSPTPGVSPTPLPSPTPEATPTPTPTPSPAAAAGTSQYWRDVVEATRSSIILPNRRLSEAERADWIAEYESLGGPNAFELEVVRLVNEIRAEYNLVQLTLNNNLMMAARFYTQTKVNLNLSLSHTAGPYGGSGGTAQAFGSSWNTANGATGGGGITPQGVVNMWMNSPGHRANILNASSRSIGVGSNNGAGSFGGFNYMLTTW